MPPNKIFRDEWLLHGEYQPWLTRVEEDSSKAHCSACKRSVGAEITSIKRHKASRYHITNMEKLQQDAQPPPPPPSAAKGVAFAIIMIACFIAEHNLPFLLVDHMIPLLKVMFPDSKIAQDLSLKRAKCTEVVKVIGRNMKGDTVNKLKTHKFSIIIDETTDISTQKACPILVRFIDIETKTIQTRLLDLVDLYGNNDLVGSCGQTLYDMLMTTLSVLDIPLDNFIGFAADGAANIMGSNNSLCSRLLTHLPGITIMKCICHSIHLCSSEAAKTLPRHCEDLLRNIYSFFSHSPKRRHDYKQFQTFCNLKPHKLLHPCQTRWLSFHDAVKRVLEQWSALKLYFQLKETEERLLSVQQIVKSLNDPAVLCYFNFLDTVLPLCNCVNLLFQRTSPTIHLVHDSVSELLGTLLGYFCTDIIQNKTISEIDPTDTDLHRPLHEIYLGNAVGNLFNGRDIVNNRQLIANVRTRCQQFLITLCIEIKKRFDLNNRLWYMASFLAPEKFLSSKSRNAVPSFGDVLSLVPRLYSCDPQIIDNEWRSIDWVTIPDEIKSTDCGVIQFYVRLMSYVNCDGRKPFERIATLVLYILSLPTSNADAERVFSKINNIKTKPRNSLSFESITSLIYISEEVKMVGGCWKYKPLDTQVECLT